MKPYYEHTGITIYHGDCLEILPTLQAASVDLVLCDLPYGATRNKWDSVLPLPVLWSEYRRIAKESAPVVLDAAQPFTAALVMSNLKEFKYQWVWQKEQGTGFLNAHKMPLMIHEDICVFYKKPPVYSPQMTAGKPYVAGVSQQAARGV